VKIIIKKLSLNIELSESEIKEFFKNYSTITSHLFNASKQKYLYVFNKLIHDDPKLFVLATCQYSYMVIKWQQDFELYMPNMIQTKYITAFVRENLLDLSKEM